ncbi:HTH-type transcriptional repressor GlcR [Collibacillus ludicampi]|uniref:HTH-type transcriptional repressor GlcR n=1 Tax=Collibacillus ludicampi TaxID=2771369 RepID=A0AAV4LBT8_9BACL|nr:DeoR/GlpR family DNA-binding transcription regulator [Collibacillus ludicampi]GIM45280.1 HTH-type transcriptional repressor GlcR [Collibacillus ludicampi]
MYQEERLISILQHLKDHKRISIQEICDLFSVSRDTARRDIIKLEEQGRIIRTRGGAILPTLKKEIFAYKERLGREPVEKRDIARVAASLIKDGDYIIMDASTTVQFVAEYLSTKNNVVVTNSIDIADLLSRKEDIKIRLLGGELNPRHRFLYGASTISKLSEYQVDKLFLGACGITSDGLTYPDEEEGYVKREMIRRADQVIVLADHTKFGKRLFHKISGFENIDIIITDQEPDGDIAAILREHNVEVIITTE